MGRIGLKYCLVMYMVDYKKLYHKMVNASEDAIRILIAAQRECEEAILSDEDIPPEQKIVPLSRDDKA